MSNSRVSSIVLPIGIEADLLLVCAPCLREKISATKMRIHLTAVSKHRLDLRPRVDFTMVFATNDVVEPCTGIITYLFLQLFDRYFEQLFDCVCIERCDNLVSKFTAEIPDFGKFEIAQEVVHSPVADDGLSSKILARTPRTISEAMTIATSSQSGSSSSVSEESRSTNASLFCRVIIWCRTFQFWKSFEHETMNVGRQVQEDLVNASLLYFGDRRGWQMVLDQSQDPPALESVWVKADLVCSHVLERVFMICPFLVSFFPSCDVLHDQIRTLLNCLGDVPATVERQVVYPARYLSGPFRIGRRRHRGRCER
ncbi:DNA/RNA polymerase, partial [Aureobasidium melanogenum]